jgi:cyclic pyranopterin phosphate synthase
VDVSADPPPRPLVDGFGRVHRDLRISITDRCNLRCTYCMPAEGLPWTARQDLLTYEEIERISAMLVARHGFDSLRLTGGEPTVRAHLTVLVAKLAALRTPDGRPVDVALTTNGVTLGLLAEELVAAGLGRVNVSLDTLRPDRFRAITRRDGLDQVLGGVTAAVAAGLSPVKVNAVVMRGVNDDEVVDLARWARETGVELRFIEFMPLDAEQGWRDDLVVSQAEILERLASVWPLEPLDAGVRGSEPASRFRYLDGGGTVGVIPTVTHAFCDRCDRVRLTAEGRLRSCLFALDEFDLRGPLREGATDDELAAIVGGAVATKWAGHRIGQPVFLRPRRSMSQIGG